MSSRPLNPLESRNLAFLNSSGLRSALLFVTATGLKKSILDATAPIRQVFWDADFHDFARQKQGKEFKIRKNACIWYMDGHEISTISMYRPRTKNGDPRVWIPHLGNYGNPDDVFAIFVDRDAVHLLNLSRFRIEAALEKNRSLRELFESANTGSTRIAEELRHHLSEIALRGPIRARGYGDTTVGMSIEHALGIRPNPNRAPDFKGIEIKSGRASITGRANRATLFACVPDWEISALKSSAEILERFGYHRHGQFKLYCTISAIRPNSQGLQFDIVSNERQLREVFVSARKQQVAVWRLSELGRRLQEKHPETFWIKVESEVVNGREYFHLKSAVHTRNPNVEQFERLIADGSITMDHLIKRKLSGAATEKGPLFKIIRSRIPELFFGVPKTYSFE